MQHARPHRFFSVADLQEQTALVETDASKLLESCKSLLEENRFAEVVEELVPRLNLMFEKAKRTGDWTEQASLVSGSCRQLRMVAAALPKLDYRQGVVP